MVMPIQDSCVPMNDNVFAWRVPIPNEYAAPPYMKPCTNVSWSVVQHSPDGPEWGYPGSGPGDLALNILNAFFPPESDGYPAVKCHRGKCSRTAFTLHHEFKFQFIATLPPEGGTIPALTIKVWIEAHRHLVKADDKVAA